MLALAVNLGYQEINMLNKQQGSKDTKHNVKDNEPSPQQFASLPKTQPLPGCKTFLAGLSGISTYHIPGYN
jgi:hypothetical protein